MSGLPERVTKDWSEDRDKHFVIRLKYLNLCSQEFYLTDKGLLSATLWGIWDAEIRATLASPPYVRAWPTLRGEFESYPEFQKFVDEAQQFVDNAIDYAGKPEPSTSTALPQPPEPDQRFPSTTRAH